MSNKNLILLSLFFSFSFFGKMQLIHSQEKQAYVHSYGLEDGLPDRTVSSIFLAPTGFIWLATDNGLCRFDGQSFLTFNKSIHNPNKINGSKISTILPLKNGEKLLLIYEGTAQVDIFDTNDFSTQIIELPFAGKGEIQSIPISQEHYFYQINEDSLYVFSLDEKGKQEIAQISSQSKASFLIHQQDSLKQNYKEFSTHQFPNTKIPSLPFFLDLGKGEFDIYTTNMSGNIIYSPLFSGELYLLDVEQNTSSLLYKEDSPKRIRKLWQDSKGNLLIGFSEDKHSRHPDIEKLLLLLPSGESEDYQFILKEMDQKINQIEAKDFKDLLYIASHNGFFKANIKKNQIQQLLQENIIRNTFGKSIRGFVEHEQGTIYFAREVENWYVFDKKTNEIEPIYLKDADGNVMQNWSNSFDLEIDQNNLWGFLCVNDNNMDCRLVQYDLKTKESAFFDPKKGINCFLKTEGGFWIGARYNKTDGGLLFFDTQKQAFETVEIKDASLFFNKIPNYILETDNNELWIGTTRGLVYVDPKTKTSQLYSVQDNPDLSLSSNYVMALHQKSPNELMIGTYGGLDILDVTSQKFQHYDKFDGLSDNRICGIVPTKENDFWISTFYGLNYFDWKTQSFRNYYERDGLTNNEFNRFSFFKDQEGTFYFGGINGFNIFEEKDLLEERDVPSPVLTQVTKYNRQQDSIYQYSKNLLEMHTITLSPYDMYCQFYFSLPSFYDPAKHQFSAFLEGFDKDWTLIGENAFVRYNKLPAGNYRLLVKGMDETGNWSNEALEIDIVVKEFFYKQWWFLLLGLLTLLAIIYTIIQYRWVQKVKREQLRTKISSDLHDEVSGLLAGIAIQSEMLQYQIKDGKINSKLESIAHVSRSAMSRMSDVLWSIDARKDTIEDLLLRMKQHLRESLDPVEKSYSLKIGDFQENKKIEVQYRENIYFIFKEAINNIVKHSNADQIEIFIQNIAGQFQLDIKDNGTKSNGSIKSGQGLSNMKMRAKQINAQILIENQNGYQVSLILPSIL